MTMTDAARAQAEAVARRLDEMKRMTFVLPDRVDTSRNAQRAAKRHTKRRAIR